MHEWDLIKLAEFSSTNRTKKDIHKAMWFNVVLASLETGR